jgi:Fe-Mn family superoxide dismutase
VKFEIPDLHYPRDALAPVISARTVEIHYEKHHKGYLEKLRKQIENKPEGERELEDLIASADGDLFNHAAQVWNHSFYWKSMRPAGEAQPSDRLRAELERGFGSLEEFKRRFSEAATGEFGSGWAWLVREPGGSLRVRSSSDAENPLRTGSKPLLTLDVWEHAYYLDHQNERGRYVEGFLDHLVNWDFIEANLEDRHE